MQGGECESRATTTRVITRDRLTWSDLAVSWVVAFLLCVIALGAFVSEAAVGFGATVIAVTLGIQLVALDVLLPAFVPVNMCLSAYLVLRHGRHIAWRLLVTRMAPPVILGLAGGLLVFRLRDALGIKPSLKRSAEETERPPDQESHRACESAVGGSRLPRQPRRRLRLMERDLSQHVAITTSCPRIDKTHRQGQFASTPSASIAMWYSASRAAIPSIAARAASHCLVRTAARTCRAS